MGPQDYSARTTYRPPAAWYRRLNRSLGVLLTSLGLAPRDAAVLVVRGRRSGKRRRTPLLTTPYRGRDYLVALAGESGWVRNVRANAGSAVLRRRRARTVHLAEVPVDERAPIIAAYLHRGRERSGPEAAATQTRSYFGLTPDPSLDEIARIASFYPVFEIADG